MCLCVAITGGEILLESKRAWLSDEERARSFGNHQVKQALDGREPGHSPKLALKKRHSIQFPCNNRAAEVCHSDSSSVCTIVGLCPFTFFTWLE